MKTFTLSIFAIAMLGGLVAAVAPSSPSRDEGANELAAGKVPTGYRDWRLISVAHEEGNLNDIRAVLGNDAAIEAFRAGLKEFPDGAVIARLAWRYTPSEEFNTIFGRAQSFVAGPPVNGLQFMVKDSKKYAGTGGWGFSQFDDGKPVDESMLASCFECHARIKDRDLVFTRYSP